MGKHHSLEQIRAWSEGTLDAEALAHFEGLLAQDQDLCNLAEAYRSVFLMSKGTSATLPESEISFADLEQALPVEQTLPVEQARRTGGFVGLPRYAALAAVVLLSVGVVLMQFGGNQKQAFYPPVNLGSIPLTSAMPSDSLALPSTLASYYPVADGQIQWLEGEEADQIASATGRPQLIFGRYNDCATADGVERSLCDDSELRALAEECVPVRVNLADLSEEDREAMMAAGYPCLLIRNTDGFQILCLSSAEVDCDMRARVREGIGSFRTAGEYLSWQLSRDLATLCARAREAESEGRLAEAHRWYEDLVAAGGRGLLAEAGERGLIRIALSARDSLLDARALSESDDEGSQRLLAEAVSRFESTPHVAELALVLESYRRTGQFPSLTWARN